MDKTDIKSLNAYMSEISEGELLTDEQEKILAEQIQKGNKYALDELTSANLRYVVKVAKQYTGRGVALEDLISEGNIGLMRAAEKFDPARGKRFVTFAAPFIRKSIEEAIDKQEGSSQPISVDEPIPLGSQNNFSLLNVLEDKDAPRADQHTEQEALILELKKVIDVLDEREQTVIKYFFGIECDHLTMAEIATTMGIKRERVRQIRDKAVRKLRKANSNLPELL
ncbi:MAG: sigma-70 family RNA polymerase sigma factor [Prevotella sp.]|nr:sigma-70 family RNA polymerase sigma factor [Prevotella sp.]